jgi:RNA polymerase sigma factor (sigma-70 family)
MIIEKQLRERVSQGDTRAHLELYHLCFEILQSEASKYVKNEEEIYTLIDNAFLKIVTHINQQNEQLSFPAWIKKIIHNEIVDEYRRMKKYKHLFDQDYLIENVSAPSYAHIDYKHAQEALAQLMNRLPYNTQRVFQLFEIEGYSHKEIAKLTGIAKETSKFHMKKARRKLKMLYPLSTNPSQTVNNTTPSLCL